MTIIRFAFSTVREVEIERVAHELSLCNADVMFFVVMEHGGELSIDDQTSESVTERDGLAVVSSHKDGRCLKFED